MRRFRAFFAPSRGRRATAVSRFPEDRRDLLAKRRAMLSGLLVVLALPALAGAQPAPQPAEPIQALEERVTALENARDALIAVTGSALIGTVAAIVLGWFRLVKKADRLARQQVDRIVESYPGAVERLVQEHETESRLRLKARVAVVSDKLDLQALLRAHGFRNLKTVFSSEATAEALETFAAVILDLTGGLSQSTAATLIRDHQRDVFLAYSTAPTRVELPSGRSTFANSPITLYARLMELLKFHEAHETAG